MSSESFPRVVKVLETDECDCDECGVKMDLRTFVVGMVRIRICGCCLGRLRAGIVQHEKLHGRVG